MNAPVLIYCTITVFFFFFLHNTVHVSQLISSMLVTHWYYCLFDNQVYTILKWNHSWGGIVIGLKIIANVISIAAINNDKKKVEILVLI